MIWLVVRDITNTKSTSTQPPSFDKILQFASYLEMKKKKKEKEAADLSGNSGIKKTEERTKNFDDAEALEKTFAIYS